MSRRYTDEQKQHALEQLAANNRNVARTSAQTGIPKRTLQEWKKLLLPPSPDVAQQQQQQQQQQDAPPDDALAVPDPALPIAAATLQSLRTLHHEMIENIHLINRSLPAALQDAPLHQRTAALSQLIDRVLKLSGQLPIIPQYIPGDIRDSGKAERLHPAQEQILTSPARFKMVVCGRRFGKTTVGKIAIANCALHGGRAWWLAPTYRMAEQVWRDLKGIISDVLPAVEIDKREKRIDFPGGGMLAIRSAHLPDNLRGEGLDFAVLDEAAFMKPDLKLSLLKKRSVLW